MWYDTQNRGAINLGVDEHLYKQMRRRLTLADSRALICVKSSDFYSLGDSETLISAINSLSHKNYHR